METLKKKCQLFNADNVHVFKADSTKIVLNKNNRESLVEEKLVILGPPFQEESLDKVLLDAPCSVLGKRPQFANKMIESQIKSFVPLQRKLVETVNIMIFFLFGELDNYFT